jgi:hypothetical protein
VCVYVCVLTFVVFSVQLQLSTVSRIFLRNINKKQLTVRASSVTFSSLAVKSFRCVSDRDDVMCTCSKLWAVSKKIDKL